MIRRDDQTGEGLSEQRGGDGGRSFHPRKMNAAGYKTLMEDIQLLAADKKTPKFTLCGQVVQAKCVDVYDGDTAQFVFRLEMNHPLYRYSCRMTGYNSAEIKGQSVEEKEKAKIARDALKGLILGRVVTLNIGKFDKYGRPLVSVLVDGQDVNAWMISGGYGAPYTGKGEKKW
jgi:endonuclease YncB( thermonuclease family)